jgi:hypothetical protein
VGAAVGVSVGLGLPHTRGPSGDDEGEQSFDWQSEPDSQWLPVGQAAHSPPQSMSGDVVVRWRQGACSDVEVWWYGGAWRYVVV